MTPQSWLPGTAVPEPLPNSYSIHVIDAYMFCIQNNVTYILLYGEGTIAAKQRCSMPSEAMSHRYGTSIHRNATGCDQCQHNNLTTADEIDCRCVSCRASRTWPQLGWGCVSTIASQPALLMIAGSPSELGMVSKALPSPMPSPRAPVTLRQNCTTTTPIMNERSCMGAAPIAVSIAWRLSSATSLSQCNSRLSKPYRWYAAHGRAMTAPATANTDSNATLARSAAIPG